MSGNPVTWFEIYVKDVQRAKAFYEKTLTRVSGGRDADLLGEVDVDVPNGQGQLWSDGRVGTNG